MSSPKSYKIFHVSPGLIKYPSIEGHEYLVLVEKKVLDEMNESFRLKPVFNEIHQMVKSNEAFNFSAGDLHDMADGIISNVGYDEVRGQYWVEAIIWDEDTQRNIEAGYLPSNSYIVDESSDGGKLNGVEYDQKVLAATYHHMAIVEVPRYSETQIVTNSKEGGIMSIWKKGNKTLIVNGEDPKKDDEKEKVDNDKSSDEAADAVEVKKSSYINTGDDRKVTLEDGITAFRNQKTEAESKVDLDDTIDVDGVNVSVRDLLAAYDAVAKADEKVDNAVEKGEKDDDDKKDEKMVDQKNNSVEKSEHFNAFAKLTRRAEAVEYTGKAFLSETERLKSGKSGYGSEEK